MRVLVLTNHFADFTGSEVVALEVARWFGQAGASVTLAANYLAAPMAKSAGAFDRVVDRIEDLVLSDYDLVWCQHDLLALLPLDRLQRAAEDGLPHVALVSLSPYEPYEHVDGRWADTLGADILGNSEETGTEIVRRAHGQLSVDRVHLFRNAAPAAFWSAKAEPPGTTLRRLVVVSNHPPPEVLGAVRRLSRAGVKVTRIGSEHRPRLIEPADLLQADSVVSIGKTVPYAIALGRPAYIYDRNGGDGWLSADNLARNFTNNFSGRPISRRLDAEALAAEIVDGYPAARRTAASYGELVDREVLTLDTHLQALMTRAHATSSAERAARLRRALLAPDVRAHIELRHSHALIARRSYLEARGHPVSALMALRIMIARLRGRR